MNCGDVSHRNFTNRSNFFFIGFCRLRNHLFLNELSPHYLHWIWRFFRYWQCERNVLIYLRKKSINLKSQFGFYWHFLIILGNRLKETSYLTMIKKTGTEEYVIEIINQWIILVYYITEVCHKRIFYNKPFRFYFFLFINRPKCIDCSNWITIVSIFRRTYDGMEKKHIRDTFENACNDE